MIYIFLIKNLIMGNIYENNWVGYMNKLYGKEILFFRVFIFFRIFFKLFNLEFVDWVERIGNCLR